MHVLRIIGLAVVAPLGAGVLVWGGLGVRRTIDLLRAAPPKRSPELSTRLEQILASYVARVRSWAVVFSAALVGAAISDFDHDPNRGAGRMLALFLLVLAVLIFVGGISIGLTGRRAALDSEFGSRLHDSADLLLSCVIAGFVLAVALVFGATALM